MSGLGVSTRQNYTVVIRGSGNVVSRDKGVILIGVKRVLRVMRFRNFNQIALAFINAQSIWLGSVAAVGQMSGHRGSG